MKLVTITAHNGKGDNKVLAGTKEVQKPDDYDEAGRMFGKEYVFKRFWAAEAIYIQNQIRTGAESKPDVLKAQLIEEARKDKANGDDTFYNRLVQLGVIKE